METVRRVVGVAGDRIHLRNKALILNGHGVIESYIQHSDDNEENYRDNFPSDRSESYPGAEVMLAENLSDGDVVVPPGRYFVLGDNRDLIPRVQLPN